MRKFSEKYPLPKYHRFSLTTTNHEVEPLLSKSIFVFDSSYSTLLTDLFQDFCDFKVFLVKFLKNCRHFGFTKTANAQSFGSVAVKNAKDIKNLLLTREMSLGAYLLISVMRKESWLSFNGFTGLNPTWEETPSLFNHTLEFFLYIRVQTWPIDAVMDEPLLA